MADVLASFSDDPGTTSLFDNRTVIDSCFAQSSVADILAALDAEGSDFAAKVAKTMRRMSPTRCVCVSACANLFPPMSLGPFPKLVNFGPVKNSLQYVVF